MTDIPPPASTSSSPTDERGMTVLHYLGIKILKDTEDPTDGVCEMVLADHVRNQAGSLNGGVVATLLDTAGGVAAHRATGKQMISTAAMHIQYLDPVTVGPARATARVVRTGSRSVVAELELVDVGDDDRLAAIGTINLTVGDA